MFEMFSLIIFSFERISGGFKESRFRRSCTRYSSSEARILSFKTKRLKIIFSF